MNTLQTAYLSGLTTAILELGQDITHASTVAVAAELKAENPGLFNQPRELMVADWPGIVFEPPTEFPSSFSNHQNN